MTGARVTSKPCLRPATAFVLVSPMAAAQDWSMKPFVALLFLAMLTASSLAADGPIRHVVHFKFKADAGKDKIAKVVEEFAALKSKIPVVEALEWGTDVSPEGLGKGYTHCWIASFKNATDRDAYLVHPDHKAFVTLLKPILEDALVIDFIPASTSQPSR
jgi:hypothetical protein